MKTNLRKSIHVKLDEDKLKALKIWCIQNNQDVSEVISRLIERFLSDNTENLDGEAFFNDTGE